MPHGNCFGINLGYSYSFGSASELILNTVSLIIVDMLHCSCLAVLVYEIISVTVTALGPYSIVFRINTASVYAAIVTIKVKPT